MLIRSDSNVSRDKDFVKEDAYLTDAFAREAVEFIEEKKRGLFFLYIPFILSFYFYLFHLSCVWIKSFTYIFL